VVPGLHRTGLIASCRRLAAPLAFLDFLVKSDKIEITALSESFH
jgi:hypothetical protein